MAIKLLLLKSGEDMIADTSMRWHIVKMRNNRRVMGYYLDRPCIIRMREPNVLDDDEWRSSEEKSGYEVSLYPMDATFSGWELFPFLPIGLVTMVEPNCQTEPNMYVEDIVNYGKDNQSDSADEQGRYW